MSWLASQHLAALHHANVPAGPRISGYVNVSSGGVDWASYLSIPKRQYCMLDTILRSMLRERCPGKS